jgi:hypothetical protein
MNIRKNFEALFLAVVALGLVGSYITSARHGQHPDRRRERAASGRHAVNRR